MSRTKRYRFVPYESHSEWTIWYAEWRTEKSSETVEQYLARDKALYYSDKHCHYYHSLPHWFRNMVNRNRRRKDKNEVRKATYLYEYDEQCSRWNCKDNNAWGYW